VRIVVDARPALDPRRTGVGHYTARLIRHLPIADPSSAYVAWYLHAKGLFRATSFFADVGAPNLVELASRFPARLFEPVASRLGVPRLEWLAGRFDALLATNFLPPATASRGVVLIVHDLAFDRYPMTAPQIDARWRRRFDRRLRASAAVIVPSTSARTDLLEAHDLPDERVHVVPHGVDAWVPPSAAAVSDTVRRYGVRAPYALFVGGIEPRKNLPALLEAFARADADVRLVIAGGRVRWFPKAEARLRAAVVALPEAVRERIVLTGYLSEPDKRTLLAGAALLAYPSLYEGFGFPVLEAMAAGVPVLTSDASSLPEIAGDAAVLVDPLDRTAIAEGLRRLLEDEALRERLSAAGLERARAFTWEATAARTAVILRGAGASGQGN
jgi:glycosyltransferase involved in cell wall biosynthesis